MTMSGSYHCGKWSLQREKVLAKLDYTGIYLQIAFSVAPVFVLLMPQPAGWNVVAVLAAAAAAGTWLTFSGRKFSRFVLVAIYTLMGLVQVVPMMTPLFGGGSSILEKALPVERWMFLVMALSYLIGGQIFANAWPRCCPDTFGFHELWHLLIVLGSTMTYCINCSVVARTSWAPEDGLSGPALM